MLNDCVICEKSQHIGKKHFFEQQFSAYQSLDVLAVFYLYRIFLYFDLGHLANITPSVQGRQHSLHFTYGEAVLSL